MVMIDNHIVKGEPGDIVCRGEAAKMPLMIGTVALDLPTAFPPRKEPYPYAYFGADAEKAREIYGLFGPLAFVEVGMDMTMHEPARFVAKAMTAAGSKAWLYRFSYVVESADLLARLRGTPHSFELPFLFQTLDAQYPHQDQVSPNDREMARKFSSYFANFAKSRDAEPNAGGLPQWSQFDPRFQLMHFRPDPGPKFEGEPRRGVALVEKVAKCP